MKNKTIAIIGAFVLVLTGLTGCAGSTSAADPAGPSAAESEEVAGMANPWVEITEEEAKQLCTRLFKAPDGAKTRVWQKCESLGDPAQNIGPLVQLDFELDGMDFTARAQAGAAEDADISGMFVEWSEGPDDVTLANWGEGNMAGKTYRAVDDMGYYDLITWYDVEIGIKYSLSVSAPDLDGFDIQAVAEQMYDPANEPPVE